jgi:hypothetical protein
MLATKDQKYMVRATKFETSVTNASSTGSIGNMWALEQTLGFTANMMRDFRSGRVPGPTTAAMPPRGSAPAEYHRSRLVPVRAGHQGAVSPPT